MKNLRGLYAITSEAICADTTVLLRSVEAALKGGAALIQYRDKKSDAAAKRDKAQRLLELCHRYRAPFIINDDAALAASIGADGVHLGRSDGDIAHARTLLGATALIGATCGDSLERAQTAIAQGANYVGFGRFFESRTKPEAPPAELALLTQARPKLRVPICAIGGLTPDNARPVIAAGADLIAAVGGIFGAEDIETAARAYTELFQ